MTAPATSASAIRFYGELFGWKFAGPGPMPGEPPGRYFVARLRERDVAGVGSLPAEAEPSTAAWYTHVAVADADESAARAGRAGGRILARPIGEPPAGRLAVVADPAGAVFCLWEPERRRGAQLVNEPSAWSMSLLQTTNPSGAETFSAEVFGWRHESFDMGEVELVLWRLPGYVGGKPGQPVPRDVVATMLSLGGDGAGEGRSHWSVDFWIDDADAAAAKATEFGGSVVVPPHDVPGFRSAVLADPHGATFSVSTLRPARPSP